jgi:septal ring factor EnvC (AmiA/AmiB activator)
MNMKKLITLIIFCFSIFALSAQPKPAPKPAAAPVAKKPTGPSPYVLKKDYDSLSTSLRSQLRAMQGSLGAIKGSIGNKDQKLDDLDKQMKQIVDVLNSTNFKISLTSDSLSKTRTSIEEVQAEAQNGIAEVKTLNEKLNSQIIILWVFIAVLLLLSVFIWMSSKKQIKAASESQFIKLSAMERSLHESKSSLEEQLNKFESTIAAESKNAIHYTERHSNALKDNIKNMNDFVNGLKDDLQTLANTVQAMNDNK